MPATRKSSASDEPRVLVIPELRQESQDFCILGLTPYIHNSMSFKVKQELLFPSGGRRTSASRAETLKHVPEQEFVDSMNTFKDEEHATLLAVMASSFKGAMMTAALDVPGTTKASIGRLVRVEGFYVPMWGTPKLFMAVTRQADAARTPDVRTRAIVAEWVSVITVNWNLPMITQTSIANLLATAGRTAGVGDWRPEKGKGDFGQFRLCNPDDPDFVRIKKEGGRKAQQRAVDNIECYDEESQDLLDWYNKEIVKRGRK